MIHNIPSTILWHYKMKIAHLLRPEHLLVNIIKLIIWKEF